MNNKIKNYLGIAVIAGVLLLGYAAASYVDSYSKSIQPSSFRSFSASGEGKIIAVPDVAEFTLTVLTSGGKDLTALQAENTVKMNKIIEFIKSRGVADKDIKTQSYNLEPRYQGYSCDRILLNDSGEAKPCPPPEIVGYTVNQTVRVKIRDFKNIGDILSGAVQNGANTASDLSFTIDDPAKLRNEARAQAIAKAREQAEIVAKAGDFRVGKLLSIDESYYPVAYKSYGMGGAALESIGGAPVAPSIEAGSQEATANATLRYEIE